MKINELLNGRYKDVRELNCLLNTFDYGAVVDGVRCDLNEVDWSKYRTLDPEVFEKERLGICWDFVNYQHRVFQKLGIPDRSFFFVKKTGLGPNDIVTHTFSLIGDDRIWFESSWSKHRGLHIIDSPMDVVSVLDNDYPPAGQPFEIHEYDAGRTVGLSPNEFFETIIGEAS